jgi:hypothetical protein
MVQLQNSTLQNGTLEHYLHISTSDRQFGAIFPKQFNSQKL